MSQDDMDASAPASTPSAAFGHKPDRAPNRYIPALDGIRALAVAAVVLYHLNIPWMSGGLLGVTMFFVISGFIITRLLIHEFSTSGAIDLRGFWIRRARRLLPAIVALITIVIILCALFNRVMLTKMRPDILPSLLFFNNWWQIAQNVSYFDALGDPSPLTHFWSLAIEEQFYLIWPVVLFIALRSGIGKKSIRRGILVAAAASSIAMLALYQPGIDPSRVYYGTDTRMFSLLLGAWLAFIPEDAMAPRKLASFLGLRRISSNNHLTDASSRIARSGIPGGAVTLVGGVGLAGLLTLFSLTNGYSPFPYRGGMLLCSILTMMLIAACLQPNGPLVELFAARPLVWLGKRSYSIYLWHFPLLSLMNPVGDVTETPWWMTLIQLSVVLIAAEASYRLIETPFRHGLVGKLMGELRDGSKPQEIARRHPVPSTCSCLLLITAIICLVAVPKTSALSDEGAALLEGGADASSHGNVDGDQGDGAQATAFPEGAFDILMIGDSVSLRTIPEFEETFPHGHIDAMKNRQFSAGLDLLDGYLANNQVGRVVVIALGTNGLVGAESIDQAMQKIGEDRVAIFVTTRSPQPWVSPTNDAIKQAAERYDNARVVDWHAYSEGRNDLFDGDGTHLSSVGAKEYIALIEQTARPELPVRPEDHLDEKVIEHARDILSITGDALGRTLSPGKQPLDTDPES